MKPQKEKTRQEKFKTEIIPVQLFHVKLDHSFFPSFSEKKKISDEKQKKERQPILLSEQRSPVCPPTPDKTSIWCIPSGKMRKKNPKTSFKRGKLSALPMKPPPTMLNKH